MVVVNVFLIFASERVLRVNRYQDNQEHRAITDWLSPANFSAQQSDCIMKRQEGTGQWLLHSEEYKQWLNQPGQTLFCPGIPGAGKTVITAITVDSLWTSFGAEEDIGVAFLYCNYKRQQEQKFQDLMASLLKQLVQERHSLPDEVNSLYRRHVDKRTRPSPDEIAEVLESVIQGYSKVYLFIDALDECVVTERDRLLKEVFKLQINAHVNLFATSRFIDDITTQFNGRMSCEIRATEKDVRSYLNNRILELPTFVSRRPDLQVEIVDEIVNAVDGM